MNLIALLYQLFLFLIPIYVANATPVLIYYAIRALGRTPHPIDRGHIATDGKRLLGDGKTIEGGIGGILAGMGVGALLLSQGIYETALPELTFPSITLLSIGAILGDLTGSWIKRRDGIARGEKAGLLDKLDFYLGAVILSLPLILRADLAVLGLLVTPFLHRMGNIIAYVLKWKTVPW